MKQSQERILVTHVGSLPRPAELLELLLARENGEPYDAQRLAGLKARGVSEIVRRQVDLGTFPTVRSSRRATRTCRRPIPWCAMDGSTATTQKQPRRTRHRTSARER